MLTDWVRCQCENLQKVGAFKYRGALNAIKRRLEQHPGEQLTFVTHSSGNHAQVTTDPRHKDRCDSDTDAELGIRHLRSLRETRIAGRSWSW